MLDLDDLDLVKEELFNFVWNFKHGDNIIYNFEILQSLYTAKENDPNPKLLNKPITVTIVSIIEAILIDFLARIDQAKGHLPAGIAEQTLNEIKIEIAKKKKPVKIEDDILGEMIYMKRKMYHYNEIVELFKKHEIFGEKGDPIYNQLKHFGDMRNRVHIENYHQNLEGHEAQVFSANRLEALEETLRSLWVKMANDYKRPW